MPNRTDHETQQRLDREAAKFAGKLSPEQAAEVARLNLTAENAERAQAKLAEIKARYAELFRPYSVVVSRRSDEEGWRCPICDRDHPEPTDAARCCRDSGFPQPGTPEHARFTRLVEAHERELRAVMPAPPEEPATVEQLAELVRRVQGIRDTARSIWPGVHIPEDMRERRHGLADSPFDALWFHKPDELYKVARKLRDGNPGLAVLCLVVFAGCSESDEDKQRKEAMQRFQEMGKAMETASAKGEKIKADVARDRTILHPKAIEKFKEAIAQNYGTEIAEAAEYEVVRVKDFGDSKWEVHGIYRGEDDRGRQMEADWVVTMEVFMGGLQTTRTSLGDRRYAEQE